MERSDAARRLATLLQETGDAHHDAFLLTDGVDPEWPSWYAQYLQPRLRASFDRSFTRSELVYHLVAASKHHEREEQGGDWAEFYAAFLEPRLAQPAE